MLKMKLGAASLIVASMMVSMVMVATDADATIVSVDFEGNDCAGVFVLPGENGFDSCNIWVDSGSSIETFAPVLFKTEPGHDMDDDHSYSDDANKGYDHDTGSWKHENKYGHRDNRHSDDNYAMDDSHKDDDKDSHADDDHNIESYKEGRAKKGSRSKKEKRKKDKNRHERDGKDDSHKDRAHKKESHSSKRRDKRDDSDDDHDRKKFEHRSDDHAKDKVDERRQHDSYKEDRHSDEQHADDTHQDDAGQDEDHDKSDMMSLFDSIDGSEFSISNLSGIPGMGEWVYTPGEGDPGVLFWAAKGGNGFTLFWDISDEDLLENGGDCDLSNLYTVACLQAANFVSSGEFGTPVNPKTGRYYELSHLTFYGNTISEVPLPSAVWLFASGLLGVVGVARRRRQ